MNTWYQDIQQLDDNQREDARENARALVLRTLGDAPTPQQFAHAHAAEYPPWVTRMIGGFMLVAFIGAAMPSLFRLYSAGRDYFLQGIGDQWQAAIVGLSTFILAEFLVILSTVSATVLFKGRTRLIFVIPVIMGLAMALVGNWTIVQPHDLFSLLEAVIPVFAVLFIAIVGERLVLHAIAERHSAQRAYALALAEYHHAAGDPEQHPRYMGYYANALRRAIIKANSAGRGAEQRKALMSALTPDHWRWIIQRELQADEWFTSRTDIASAPALAITSHHPEDEQRRPFGLTAIVQADPDDTKPTLPASEHIATAANSTVQP